MKELDKEFEDRGFKFEQIKRIDNIALYRRYKIGHPKSFHYEVIKVLSNKDSFLWGRFLPASEYYPGWSVWGTCGFTYCGDKFGEAQSLKKFEELLAHNTLRANTLEEK